MLNLIVINNITLKSQNYEEKLAEYTEQNYPAKFERSVVETDKPAIIMGNFNITFSETDGIAKKLARTQTVEHV